MIVARERKGLTIQGARSEDTPEIQPQTLPPQIAVRNPDYGKDGPNGHRANSR